MRGFFPGRIGLAARRVALELLLWLTAPCAFLAWYARYPHVTWTVVAPHLAVVLVPVLVTSVLRIFIVRLLGSRAARALSAFVLATTLLALWLYYAAVVAGLKAWGRVISYELVASYLDQAPAFAEALAIPLSAVVAALLLAYGLMMAAAFLYVRVVDWVAPMLSRFSEQSCATGAGLALVACILELAVFFAAPPVEKFEPVSLTLYPDLNRHNMQGRWISPQRAAMIDAAEDAERTRYVANPRANRHNVVVVVVDALRADRMGVYGYGRETTPNLSRLQRAGALDAVPQARASCGSSNCGITSLLASKFVHEFSERPFTLFEVLKRHGYRVDVMLSGDHTNFYGLKRIYEPHDSYFDGAVAGRSLDYKNDDRLLIDHASRLPRWDRQPVMLYFHLMSTHPIGKHYPQFQRYQPASPYMPSGRTDAEHAGNQYDNAVLQADGIIAELFDTLRARGYLDNTLVVITADHGEALGEHGAFGHPQSLDEEVLRIPLLFIASGFERRRLSRPGLVAAQVDIAPTILAELDMEAPRTWSGVPLQREPERDFTYFDEPGTAGIIDYRDAANVWKYRVDRRSHEEQAFNLSTDPQGDVDAIAQTSRALRRDWRARFAEHIAEPSERLPTD
jgi:glucan phosphoethanolaminetransferase (alkaline phosphatase superfamily)